MNQNNSKIFKTEYWSVKLNKEWNIEFDKGIYTFFNPKGYGALQITMYFKNTIITIEDIIVLAEFDSKKIQNIKQVKYGDFKGLELINIAEREHYLRRLWLAHGKTLIFVTYNCSIQDKTYEENEVNSILFSLKAYTTN